MGVNIVAINTIIVVHVGVIGYHVPRQSCFMFPRRSCNARLRARGSRIPSVLPNDKNYRREKNRQKIQRRKTICGTPWNYTFQFFEGLEPQIWFQNLSLTIWVGVGSGVCPKSAWSPSYEKIIFEIGHIWTTTAQYQYYNITRAPLRDRQGSAARRSHLN